MAEPLLSVIVPCYNAEKHLPTLFKCLEAQTYSNMQAIFVNDGSKDGTEELLKAYEGFDINLIDKYYPELYSKKISMHSNETCLVSFQFTREISLASKKCKFSTFSSK